MGAGRAAVYFLLAVWCGVASLALAQQLPEVSRDELVQALSTEQGAQTIVNCMVNFQQGCDPRLMRIGESVPALLSNNFNCRPPVCSANTAANVKYFVTTMQKNYPRLWRQLISNASLI